MCVCVCVSICIVSRAFSRTWIFARMVLSDQATGAETHDRLISYPPRGPTGAHHAPTPHLPRAHHAFTTHPPCTHHAAPRARSQGTQPDQNSSATAACRWGDKCGVAMRRSKTFLQPISAINTRSGLRLPDAKCEAVACAPVHVLKSFHTYKKSCLRGKQAHGRHN